MNAPLARLNAFTRLREMKLNDWEMLEAGYGERAATLSLVALHKGLYDRMVRDERARLDPVEAGLA